jgi:hypothetical protein
MGFRFYRRIKIFPGVRINLSRSGVSTSIGVKGARITVGHGKVRETVGLPGTGLSYTHVEGMHQAHQDAPGEAHPQPVTEPLPKGRAWRGWLWIVVMVAIMVVVIVRLSAGAAYSTERDGRRTPVTCADIGTVDAALADPQSGYFYLWDEEDYRRAIQLSNSCSGPAWSYAKDHRATLLIVREQSGTRQEADRQNRQRAQQLVEESRQAQANESARQQEVNSRRESAQAAFNQANEALAECRTTKRGELYEAATAIIADIESKATAQQAIARERRVGEVSGMVDKVALHDAGESIIEADEDMRERWAAYKKLGGTAKSPQAISRNLADPCVEQESALESVTSAIRH